MEIIDLYNKLGDNTNKKEIQSDTAISSLGSKINRFKNWGKRIPHCFRSITLVPIETIMNVYVVMVYATLSYDKTKKILLKK